MFFFQLLIGAVLICMTMIIHAVTLDRLMFTINTNKNAYRIKYRRFWKITILMTAVLGVFGALIVEIWIWALFYLSVEALQTLETALYFSTVTFTTAGFGDIVLDRDWRLLSSFQAANGFILFGWSTAFIFEVMSKLYEQDS